MHKVTRYIDIDCEKIDNLINELVNARQKIYKEGGQEAIDNTHINYHEYNISLEYKTLENEKEKEQRLKYEDYQRKFKKQQLDNLLKDFGFTHAGNGHWEGPCW